MILFISFLVIAFAAPISIPINRTHHVLSALPKNAKERLFPSGVIDSRYYGFEGYALYADTFHHGSMRRAKKVTAQWLSQEELESLNWGPTFNSSTQERSDIRKFLMAKNHHIHFIRWFESEGFQRATQQYVAQLGQPEREKEMAKLILTAVTNDERRILNWNINLGILTPDQCGKLLK